LTQLNAKIWKKVPEGDCVKLGAFQRVPEGHRVIVAATHDLMDIDKNQFLAFRQILFIESLRM
jgi:hypothetical protein